MNIIGNIIGQKVYKVVKFIEKFFFKKSIVWIDNTTLTADQDIISNVDWELVLEEKDS